MKKIHLKITSVILCILMVMMVFPEVSQTGIADAIEDTRPPAIVSMGDSYSSGEGIPDFYGNDLSPTDKLTCQDWLAHRSEKSWPGMLTFPGIEGTMAENRNKHWYFVASSGAVTSDIKDGQCIYYNRDGYTETLTLDPQIAIFDKLEDKRIEYVTLTIGGNDVQFANIIAEASLGGYFIKGTLPQKLEEVWDDFYNGGIRENIKQAYHDIYNRAKQNNPDVKIIVAGYPKLVDKNGKGYQFTKIDAQLINDSVEQFNNELEMLVNSCKAEGMRICFVPVEGEFDGKEAYSTTVEEEYINRIYVLKQEQDLNHSGIGSSYSIHPNENGAKAYARCVQSKIDEIEKDGGKSEWPTLISLDSIKLNLLNGIKSAMGNLLNIVFKNQK